MKFLTPLNAIMLHKNVVRTAIFVVFLHLLAMLAKYGFGRDYINGLVPLFDLYEEKNIPTYFSSINLLIAAFLLHQIAVNLETRQRSQVRAWKTLAGLFVFLSIDEFADLRILLSKFLKSHAFGASIFDQAPALIVAWTVPAMALVIFIGVLFIPFLWSLKTKYAVAFIACGAVFVFAAVGLETVQGHVSIDTGGVRSGLFMLLVTIEETLEMFSIIVFEAYLIKYFTDEVPIASV